MENPQKPDNYMVWAILSTLFCCLPLGIASILSASKVNQLYRAGNYQEAQKSSNMAKKLAIISAVVGLVVNAIYIFFVMSGGE